MEFALRAPRDQFAIHNSCTYLLKMHDKLWQQTLPALVRGVEIFHEMAWSGRERSDGAYTVLGYLDLDGHPGAGSKAPVRRFPSERLKQLQHYRSRECIRTPRRILKLEYAFGCICLNALRDDWLRWELDESDSDLAGAKHATIDTYFAHLIDNPITVRQRTRDIGLIAGADATQG